MSASRLGGYALCVSALINILQAVWYATGGDDTALANVMELVGAVLLILGLASCLLIIQRLQPGARRAGELGLALMAAAALLSLALNIYFIVGGPITDLVSLAGPASALLELTGVLLVGSVTIRTGVFSVWASWLLIAGGVLNFIGGLIAPETLAPAIGLTSVLMISSALVGFGLRLLGKPTGQVTAEGRAEVRG
jgi:hypothetical protein